MNIGVFDSGLGGLLVTQAIRARLPQYDYIYYGDTKHVPYGDRSEREIYELTKRGVAYLFAEGCGIVILACNTASAETLRRLQDEYLPSAYPDRKILGVIIPVVEEVISHTCTQVLLIGTQRTVGSGKYHLELGKRNELHTKIEAIATPVLVPLIESGNITEAVARTKQEIDVRLDRGDVIDGVILGCTHYGAMLPDLKQCYPAIQFFSQTEIIPFKLEQYLNNHQEIEHALSKKETLKVCMTERKETYLIGTDISSDTAIIEVS